MAIKPYDEPAEAGDILYRYFETQVFSDIRPDTKIGSVEVNGERHQLLQWLCEEITTTCVAIISDDSFEVWWSVGNVYVEDIVSHEVPSHWILNEQVARWLFPSLSHLKFMEE